MPNRHLIPWLKPPATNATAARPVPQSAPTRIRDRVPPAHPIGLPRRLVLRPAGLSDAAATTRQTAPAARRPMGALRPPTGRARPLPTASAGAAHAKCSARRASRPPAPQREAAAAQRRAVGRRRQRAGDTRRRQGMSGARTPACTSHECPALPLYSRATRLTALRTESALIRSPFQSRGP